MKLIIRPLTENAVSAMRRVGYTFQREENGEMSFIRPLATSGYPRFHCYTKQDGLSLIINLHLDQKKHTYGDTTRHHGEYEHDGPVKDEVARIQAILGDTVKII